MKEIIKEYKWFFILVIIFFVAFLFLVTPYRSSLSFYSFTFYYLNYDFGFIARGLIGTIFKLIFGIITYKKIYISMFIISVYLLFLIAFIFGELIKKYKNTKIIYFLISIFIISPASFLYMFQNGELGRLDEFLFINALVSFILIYKRKFLYLIPVISVISILIHENYIFFYLPFISMLLLFNYFDKKEKNNIKIFILNLICSFIAFLLVYTIGKHTGFTSASEYGKFLQLQSDFAINETVPYYEYFQSLSDMFNVLKHGFFSNQNIFDYIYAFITLTMYSLLLWNIVLKHKYKETKYKKTFLLLFISCFSAFCLFFIGVDYGRWYVNMVNNLVILTVFIMFDNTKLIAKKLKKIGSKYYVIIITMFLLFLFMFNTECFHFLKFYKLEIIINHLFH